MKIAIISGSQRLNSQTLKVSRFLETELTQMQAETSLIGLAALNLPLSNTEQAKNDTEAQERWREVSAILQSSDGFIIACPEWNGSVTPILVDFFLRCDRELAHKPALIVSVSSGMGGAFVIPELRIASYKNKLINYIPEHLIVRHCNEVMNYQQIDENNNSKEDLYIKKRAQYALEVLLKYTQSMKEMRSSGMPSFALSSNGMS